MTDTHRPAFCGCGRPTHSPLTTCQPDTGDQTPRTCAQAAITRVRALADQLDNLERVDTGGMWLTEWVAAKIRAAITGDSTATPDTGTCDASVLGLTGDLVGPCILRHGHDGPVHQAADRTRWAPTTTRTQPIPVDQLADGHAVDDEEPDLGPGAIWPPPLVPEPCDAAGPWGDAHACYHPAGHEGPHEAADGCNWRNAPEADRA